MRLVIDMQGAQSTGSRNRGIGRYTTSLVKAMVEQRGDSEVILVLNGMFPDTIEPIRAEFSALLPVDCIRVWSGTAPCNAVDSAHDARRKVAEKIREAFLVALRPDVVLVTSLFEGLVDDAVTSIGEFTSTLPSAVVLYDLIPLIHREIYLANPVIQSWYLKKIDQLRRADLLLSISASSGREGVVELGFPEAQVVNISTACDAHFQPINVGAAKRMELQRRYGLSRPFVMYTGGIDHRKNIEGLIRAYAGLPVAIRKEHQLAVVCSVQEPDQRRLEALAREAGLGDRELVMTGFVSENDLLALYNTCKLFVFPSWHEGFGLPALEAMACGRAVIGANTSSVPEVIGRDDALFDPRSDTEISEKMREVLTDDAFRRDLEAYGPQQAARFSWVQSAQQAWRALRPMKRPSSTLNKHVSRPRLAYISPVPGARSGIADYSAELLPELARYYRIDVIVCQDDSVQDAWINANCPLRTIGWFREHANEFERVLYHFGNSPFHSQMFALLQEIPGVIVLHDFFLGNIVSHMEWLDQHSGYWSKALLSSHGWPAMHFRHNVKDVAEAAWAYPCNLEVLQGALGVIVHSENSRRLADVWYGSNASQDWAVIPLMRIPVARGERDLQRSSLGIAPMDFVVCSFGLLGRTKLNRRLLDAWLASPMAADPSCRLVFVGENDSGQYGAEMVKAIRGARANVEITGWVNTDTYRCWLGAASAAVQLRTLSRGETSAAVLDCLNYALPTIVNANGAMADLPKDTVYQLPDEFTDSQLVKALTDLWRDRAQRLALGERGRQLILKEHQPRRCADLYRDAIESFNQSGEAVNQDLCNAIAKTEFCGGADNTDKIIRALVENFPPKIRLRQLLLDISILVQIDAKSGIQRVVRSLLNQFLLRDIHGFRVEPVYSTGDSGGYYYARRYAHELITNSPCFIQDEVVEVWEGDIFLGLDLAHDLIMRNRGVLKGWRNRGVKVYSVVYDLLPVLQPEYFPERVDELHANWLKTISEFDGALAISKAVANDLYDWLQVYGPERKSPYKIHWFHLGADVEHSLPSLGMPPNSTEVLAELRNRVSFLMVGTIEPRKGYRQVLEAFELLWSQGLDISLVMVGKTGWKMDKFTESLLRHPELGKRLYWPEDVSDEYLQEIYSSCACLIAASEGEGFGLPLIEAARHGLPILARDIPVFHEVAGECASYFDDAVSADILAEAIQAWLKLHNQQRHPQSVAMPWLTWSDSADQALVSVMGGQVYRTWMPDGIIRYCGNDPRLHTQVGERRGQSMYTSGQAGFLFYGPYESLAVGYYRITLSGTATRWSGSETFDISFAKGSRQLLHAELCQHPSGTWVHHFEIDVTEAISDFEVRLWVADVSKLSVARIEFQFLEAADFDMGDEVIENLSTENADNHELHISKQKRKIAISSKSDAGAKGKKHKKNKY